MSTTERGRKAEQLAANYLEQRGFKIVAANWHNRYAEIDLIHIIEVKYRTHTSWGDGFEAITLDKLSRLKNAAQVWVSQNNHMGPFQIDVISVSGELNRPIIEYLPNITG
jgi:putative endonuclease